MNSEAIQSFIQNKRFEIFSSELNVFTDGAALYVDFNLIACRETGSIRVFRYMKEDSLLEWADAIEALEQKSVSVEVY